MKKKTEDGRQHEIMNQRKILTIVIINDVSTCCCFRITSAVAATCAVQGSEKMDDTSLTTNQMESQMEIRWLFSKI